MVQGATLAAGQVWYDAVAGLLKIDTNGDRIADATVSVNLGLTAPQILLSAVTGGTQLTFAPAMPPVLKIWKALPWPMPAPA